MVKHTSAAIFLATFLTAGCQQQASSSRSVPAIGIPGVTTGSIQIDGDYKEESVRGYIRDYAERWQLKSIGGKKFELPSIPAGSYNLWVMAEGTTEGSLVAMAAAIEVGEGKTIGPFTLQNAATVEGSIKASAERLAEIKVSIPGTDFIATPNADGIFVLNGLPATTMSLLISEPAGDIATTDGLVTDSGSVVTIPEVDLTQPDGTPPVIDPPSTTKVDKKLAGGSLVLNGGVLKTNIFKISVQFVPPTGATEVLMSENIELPGSWQAIPLDYTHTFTGDGVHNLYAKYRDATGIESDQVYGTVDINTAQPAAGTLKLTSGYTITNSRTVSLALTATGVNAVRFALTQAGLAAAAWKNYVPVQNNFDLGGDAEGDYPVWFQLRSEYGVEGAAQSQTFKIVKTGPTLDAVVTKTGKASFNNRNVVLVTTPGTTPFDIKYVMVSCNGTTFDKLNFNSVTNEVTVDILTSKAGCPLTEGLRTLQVKLEDSLGNAGAAVSIPITYDISLPAKPVITQPTGSYSMTAAFTVSGTAEALSEITIKGATADVTTMTDGAGNWSTSVDLKLNQVNSLSVTAKDEALNTSLAELISVTHDSIPPALATGPTVKLTAESMEVVFTTSEPATVVIDYGITTAYGAQKVGAVAATSHTQLLNNLAQNQEYHFRITLADQAGNVFTSADYVRRTYIDKSAILLQSEVWDQTVTPYYVSGNFRVDEGLSVRIKKGVTIALEAGTQIWVRGELIAEGTAAEPVKFTTNNPVPQAGDWDRIEFNDASAPAYTADFFYDGGSRLNHVIVEYGGSNGTSILVKQRSMMIANSIVRHSAGFGIRITDKEATGSVMISRNTIENTEGGGIKIDVFDPEEPYGQKALLAGNIVRNTPGRAVVVDEYLNVSATGNLFENGLGVKVQSVDATFTNNIFSALPGSLILDAVAEAPLTLTVNKNSFVGSTSAGATVMEDAAALNGTDNEYILNFSQNTVHNNNSTGSGSALIELDHPDTFDIDYVATARANFANNNFINNNVGTTNRYVLLSKSFRDYNDFVAQNNYWGETNPLNVQQKYIFDYTDNNVYRSFQHAPVLSAHSVTAPMSPPLGLAVTSPAAGTAVLTWTLNTESDIGGYFIYYSQQANDLLAGTGAAEGNSKIDTESGAVSCTTGATTKSCTLTGLTPGNTYYFSVTAYDGGDRSVGNFTEPGATNTVTDTINLPSHGFRDGQRVRLSTVVGGALPAGLSDTVNYWVTFVDVNNIRLRTTQAPGPYVDITASGSLACKVIPNFPFRTAGFFTAIGASANTGTDIITLAAHGLTSGVRGKFSSVGTVLGLDTTTEYYVTYISASEFKVSKDGERVSPVDLGLTGGYAFGDNDVNFTTDTFSIQSHELQNNTEVQLTTTGTLPSPLATATNYYVVNRTAHTFQLSTVMAGAAIDITGTPVSGTPHKITPTTPGGGPVTFVPNYPDAALQDFQVLGNESWFAPKVSTTIN